MSAFLAIDGLYQSGVEAQLAKDYEQAYRYFLACEIYFKNGDLPVYIPDYEDIALKAERRKWKMMKRLPDDVQRRLRREYIDTFGAGGTDYLFLTEGWREKCARMVTKRVGSEPEKDIVINK